MWASAAKALRLGFHDCLKYKDGQGGCDGCLHFKAGKIDEVFDYHKMSFAKVENEFITNNNGLGHLAQVLEQIYINPDYPNSHNLKTPKMEVSLKASGKSRADLWALAAIVAVEFSIEVNNLVCDANGAWNGQCNSLYGEPECKVNLPRPIKFQTGRRDCVETGEEPYVSVKDEIHPNPWGSGQDTLDFYSENFGFNGRQSIAIMGSHTIGRFHGQISLLPYVWITNGERTFNNQYFR